MRQIQEYHKTWVKSCNGEIESIIFHWLEFLVKQSFHTSGPKENYWQIVNNKIFAKKRDWSKNAFKPIFKKTSKKKEQRRKQIFIEVAQHAQRKQVHEFWEKFLAFQLYYKLKTCLYLHEISKICHQFNFWIVNVRKKNREENGNLSRFPRNAAPGFAAIFPHIILWWLTVQFLSTLFCWFCLAFLVINYNSSLNLCYENYYGLFSFSQCSCTNKIFTICAIDHHFSRFYSFDVKKLWFWSFEI